MQNQGRILKLVDLIILNIIVLALMVANTYAQENLGLHQKTLYFLAQNQSSKPNAHITVGKSPSAIAVDRHLNKIYVANVGDNTVSVIDGRNNIKVKDIPVGKQPIAIGVDDGDDKIYVANNGDNTVSVIDGIKDTNIKNITVGKQPIAIGVDTYNTKIYVANNGDNTVSVIDGKRKDTNIETIPVGKSPYAIAVGTTSYRHIANLEIPNKIYVANVGDNTVSVIDIIKDMNIKTIPVGKSPYAIGLSHPTPSGRTTHKIYVTNAGDDTVSVIDSQDNIKIAKNIPVGMGPSAIGVDEVTNTTYVTNAGDDTVSVIDSQANKVVARVIFDIEPINTGFIECDKIKAPLAQEFYIYSGSECIAKPYAGLNLLVGSRI